MDMVMELGLGFGFQVGVRVLSYVVGVRVAI